MCIRDRAYALRLLEEDPTVKLTNYGCFLERFPPEYEAEIVENLSLIHI